MATKKVTIQDVAAAAGVSTATVSRALSNAELVHESTRIKVQEAVRITGYRVNRAARSLRKRQAGAVLVLVPDLGNSFFSKILEGLSAEIAKSDYSVIILDSRQLLGGYSSLADYFLDSRVDGMVSIDGLLPLSVLQQLEANGISNCIVSSCEWGDEVDLPSVRSDNFKGATLAVQHLYDLGHRKIAHVTGPEDNNVTIVRRDAMLAARSRLNLPSKPEWIIRGDFCLEAGRQAAASILALHPDDRPTAVFCASDEIACGLIAALHREGVNVPEDMSVIGFDDVESAEHYIPALTTIRQDRIALGRLAAKRLMQMLEAGEKLEASVLDLVDVELVVRDSTARPRQSDDL